MKTKTREEIEAFARGVFTGDDWTEPDWIIDISNDRVRIEVEQMYEYVECGLKELLAVSEFFGTTNVHDDRWHSNGCDSCDYGSSYRLCLTIRPEQSHE